MPPVYCSGALLSSFFDCRLPLKQEEREVPSCSAIMATTSAARSIPLLEHGSHSAPKEEGHSAHQQNPQHKAQRVSICLVGAAYDTAHLGSFSEERSPALQVSFGRRVGACSAERSPREL